MKKKRIVAVILLKNGFIVQSKQFSRFQNLGNPTAAVKRFSEWSADELVYLDISRDEVYDYQRTDISSPRSSMLDVISDVAKISFMPIVFGGKIRTLEDIEQRLARGADKISINTAAIENPAFVTASAKEFGSQCIVVSVDVKKVDGKDCVMTKYGSTPAGLEPIEWAKKLEGLGAGEILLNSVDRDGMKNGYDLELCASVAEAVRIPVIACGGVGGWEHFGEALSKTKVDAVAAANIFHFTDQSMYNARKYLFDRSFNVRAPDLLRV